VSVASRPGRRSSPCSRRPPDCGSSSGPGGSCGRRRLSPEARACGLTTCRATCSSRAGSCVRSKTTRSWASPRTRASLPRHSREDTPTTRRSKRARAMPGKCSSARRCTTSQRPVTCWRRSGGGRQAKDGHVSIEVDPNLAGDSEATIAQATYFHETIARPNLMVKIPATDAGLPAIEEMTSRGYSINVTLIFSLTRHRQIAEAYLRGLERLLARGGDPAGVHSVVSFFVSRVDTETDRLLALAGRDDLKRPSRHRERKACLPAIPGHLFRRAVAGARGARRDQAALLVGFDVDGRLRRRRRHARASGNREVRRGARGSWSASMRSAGLTRTRREVSTPATRCARGVIQNGGLTLWQESRVQAKLVGSTDRSIRDEGALNAANDEQRTRKHHLQRAR
jgi:hypothetical protein